jgi:hypothetical protein
MKQKITLLCSLACLISCTKVVDLHIGNNNSKIVIEGGVSNTTLAQEVKITRSIDFTEDNIYPEVTNALVTIIDNAGQTDTLSYKGNGLYQGTNLTGVTGRTYTLTINVNDTLFVAKSTMPSVVNLDSLAFVKMALGPQTQINVIPIFTDPTAIGNNYRYILSKNGKVYNGHYVFTDNINNGKVNQIPVQAQNAAIKNGDTVQVEMQCIDYSTYNYFYALSTIAFNGPGGGTTPSNPVSNISGGALGFFSAYTSQQKTIVIPE